MVLIQGWSVFFPRFFFGGTKSSLLVFFLPSREKKYRIPKWEIDPKLGHGGGGVQGDFFFWKTFPPKVMVFSLVNLHDSTHHTIKFAIKMVGGIVGQKHQHISHEMSLFLRNLFSLVNFGYPRLTEGV